MILESLEELLELRLRACLINEVLQVDLILAHVLVVWIEEYLGNLEPEFIEVIFLKKVLEMEQLLRGSKVLGVAQLLESEASVRRRLE